MQQKEWTTVFKPITGNASNSHLKMFRLICKRCLHTEYDSIDVANLYENSDLRILRTGA